MADEQFEVESVVPEIEFEFNGDLLTIIYGCLYGVLLIILFVYMYILKKKKGLDGNIFGMVWATQDLIMTAIYHILDTGSDIGVLLVFLEEALNESNETPSEAGSIPGVNMWVFFVVSLIIFLGYRFKSGFDVYRVTKSGLRTVLQIIFDAEVFRIVYINLKLGEFEPIGLLKYYCGEEALFESAAQSIIQFVFLLLTDGIADAVIYVSFIFSLSNTVGYIQEIDALNCDEHVTDGFSIVKLLTCCCKKKKENMETQQNTNIELNIQKDTDTNEATTDDNNENAGTTTDGTELKTDEETNNKGEENKEGSDDDDEEEIESNCICCSKEWVVETIFRWADVVSKLFIYALMWVIMGVYWFLLTLFIEIFLIWLIIRKKENAWAWEYLYVLLGIAVFPERSRPEDSLLTISICCLKDFVTKSFWIIQYIERIILIVLIGIFAAAPFKCGKSDESELTGCVPGPLRRSRIGQEFTYITYIFVGVCTIFGPLLFKFGMQKWILKCKSDHTSTVSNNINECIFHHDLTGLKAMLLYGVDPNVYDEVGVTPLWTACTDGNLEAIKILFEQPTIDPNRPMNNKYRSCCIHAACIRNQEEIMKLFINNPKIDVNVIDARGAAPLDAAIYYDQYYGKDHTNNIQMLRDKNAKFNIFNDDGKEPEFDKFCVFWLKNSGMILTEAANQGYTNFIREYLSKKDEMAALYGKIDVEFRNRFIKKMTALELAANKGYQEICQMLLENGWKKDAKKNEFKKTAEELARENGFEECALYIQNFVK